MSRKPRVLVTRPEPGATETTSRLESLGFFPLKLPLQETRALPVHADGLPGEFAAVAVPSASAIRHAPRALLDRITDLPCFAVGEATAKTALKAGFREVVEADGDAESLAAAVIASRPAGPVAYLCGKVRRPVFEDRLTATGVGVVPVETYDTVMIAGAAARMAEIAEDGVDYAMVYSAGAARALTEAIEKQGAKRLLAKTVLLCISSRVAGLLSGVGSEIDVASQPSEKALLALLLSRAKAMS